MQQAAARGLMHHLPNIVVAVLFLSVCTILCWLRACSSAVSAVHSQVFSAHLLLPAVLLLLLLPVLHLLELRSVLHHLVCTGWCALVCS
jgi:hypothetical protein